MSTGLKGALISFQLSRYTREITFFPGQLGYTLQSVNGQFHQLYLSDYRKIPLAQFDSLYGRWEDEILASAQVAARSQAALSTLQSSSTEAAAISDQNDFAPSGASPIR